MPVSKRIDYFATEAGVRIEEILRSMAMDPIYNTESSYSANALLYPDNLIPFVEKHKDYLKSHPMINPEHYIANLRLMTRVK